MRPEARIAKLITYVSKLNDIKLLKHIKTMTSCPETNLALVCNTSLFHKMVQRVNEPLEENFKKKLVEVKLSIVAPSDAQLISESFHVLQPERAHSEASAECFCPVSPVMA